MSFQKLHDVVAGALPFISQLEDGGDCVEGASTCRGVSDKEEPVDSSFRIVALAVDIAVGFGDDTNVLVLADGFGREPRFVGELSDFHGVEYSCLTF